MTKNEVRRGVVSQIRLKKTISAITLALQYFNYGLLMHAERVRLRRRHSLKCLAMNLTFLLLYLVITHRPLTLSMESGWHNNNVYYALVLNSIRCNTS